jgi:hypothetical protein
MTTCSTKATTVTVYIVFSSLINKQIYIYIVKKVFMFGLFRISGPAAGIKKQWGTG